MTTTTTTTAIDVKAEVEKIRHYAALLHYHVYNNDIPLQRVLGDEGNKKIPSTTAIFNMGAATDCPSMKLGLCSAARAGVKCYARKSECAARPGVLPYRRRQEKYWKEISAEEFAAQFITLNATKAKPFNALRLNEAGDFWGQACVDKAEKVARILKKYGVVTYCYTSRSDLDYHRVRALRISGSGFKKAGVVNVFMIVDSIKDKPKGYGVCPMDCKSCTRCHKAGIKTVVLKH